MYLDIRTYIESFEVHLLRYKNMESVDCGECFITGVTVNKGGNRGKG